MTVAVSARDRELWGMRAICTHFPVVFPNGTEWTEYEAYCAECEQRIPNTDLRGTVTFPFPGMACIEAAGICRSCLLLTRFYHRLHDDARISGRAGGRWAEWRAEPGWRETLGRVVRTVIRWLRK